MRLSWLIEGNNHPNRSKIADETWLYGEELCNLFIMFWLYKPNLTTGTNTYTALCIFDTDYFWKSLEE